MYMYIFIYVSICRSCKPFTLTQRLDCGHGSNMFKRSAPGGVEESMHSCKRMIRGHIFQPKPWFDGFLQIHQRINKAAFSQFKNTCQIIVISSVKWCEKQVLSLSICLIMCVLYFILPVTRSPPCEALDLKLVRFSVGLQIGIHLPIHLRQTGDILPICTVPSPISQLRKKHGYHHVSI